MTTLYTDRLLLTPTPLHVLHARLGKENFTATLEVHAEHGDAQEPLEVHFPEEWPGDAMVLVPIWIRELSANPQRGMWGGTIIERASLVAVGQMTFKGPPDTAGTLELGYGINPSYQGRGYATEMARRLTTWALEQPNVRRVTAECLETNHASSRVLAKAGFQQVGTREDDEGMLEIWERTAQ